MKKTIPATLVLAAIVAAGTLFSSSGCRKKKDTIAKIQVYDADNNAVSGAKVTLEGEETPPKQNIVKLVTSSNRYGEAVFTFNDIYQLGQAGVAVLKITAVKGTEVGTGVINIQAETTSKETVFI